MRTYVTVTPNRTTTQAGRPARHARIPDSASLRAAAQASLPGTPQRCRVTRSDPPGRHRAPGPGRGDYQQGAGLGRGVRRAAVPLCSRRRHDSTFGLAALAWTESSVTVRLCFRVRDSKSSPTHAATSRAFAPRAGATQHPPETRSRRANTAQRSQRGSRHTRPAAPAPATSLQTEPPPASRPTPARSTALMAHSCPEHRPPRTPRTPTQPPRPPSSWLHWGMAAFRHGRMAAWLHGGMAAGCQYIGYDITVQKNYDIGIRHRRKTLQHRSKNLRCRSFILRYRN